MECAHHWYLSPSIQQQSHTLRLSPCSRLVEGCDGVNSHNIDRSSTLNQTLKHRHLTPIRSLMNLCPLRPETSTYAVKLKLALFVIVQPAKMSFVYCCCRLAKYRDMCTGTAANIPLFVHLNLPMSPKKYGRAVSTSISVYIKNELH